jgi:hypothetical protein
MRFKKVGEGNCLALMIIVPLAPAVSRPHGYGLAACTGLQEHV